MQRLPVCNQPGCDLVQPDFVMVRQERISIIHDRRIHGVPDLIAEVMSPGSTTYDEGVKLLAYERAGVPEYIVIDPGARLLRHYRLDADNKYEAPHQYREGETAVFAIAPSIQILAAELFAGSPDTTL